MVKPENHTGSRRGSEARAKPKILIDATQMVDKGLRRSPCRLVRFSAQELTEELRSLLVNHLHWTPSRRRFPYKQHKKKRAPLRGESNERTMSEDLFKLNDLGKLSLNHLHIVVLNI